MTLTRRSAALLFGALVAAGVPAGWAVLSSHAWIPGASALERAGDLAAGTWVCPMHPDVRQGAAGVCPECGMALTPAAAGHSGDSESAAGRPTHVVVSIDARRQQLMGVRTAPVTRTALTSVVSALGTVRSDPARMVEVNLKVEGWIDRLFVTTTGQFLRRGDPLFSLESPALQATQLEYVQALKKRDLTKQPDGPDYAGRVRERLTFLDVPSDQVAAMEAAGRPLPSVLFRSPIDGWVVDLRAVRGMRAMPGEMLARVVDLSTVRVEAAVRDRDRAMLHSGSRATVTIDAFPGEHFDARVVSIAPIVDERTRTTQVQFEVANQGGRLHPGMNAIVGMEQSLTAALVVPLDAMLDSGERQMVFVTDGNGFFEPRQVTIGRRTETAIQILAGVNEGERVAVAANFLIDSESQLQSALSSFAGHESEPASSLSAAQALSVTLLTKPDPPRAGAIGLELSARTPDGLLLTSSELGVVFSMPAMPSMNMPAMRHDTRLARGVDGVFRGTGYLSMPGRWDVFVRPSGANARLAAAHLTLLAR